MLNKLGRKRMTITVGKRKPTLADEVDSMVVISVEKTSDPRYTEMTIPKPRSEGAGGPIVWHGTLTDLSELIQLPIEQPQVPSDEEIVDAFGKLVMEGLVENTVKGGTNPQAGPITPLDLKLACEQNEEWKKSRSLPDIG